MRAWTLLPLLALAGCGGSESNESAAAAPNLPAGQYELTSEVTQVVEIDEGRPQIDAEVGQRATESVCIGEGDRIPPALFAGNAYECEHFTYYASGGRLNLEMRCAAPRGEGTVSIGIDGTFGDGTFESTRRVGTAIIGGGNRRVFSRLTGRRTGDCTPGAEGEADANAGNPAG